MKVAIMQPYIFPYLGYFQLVHSVDKFVFYDDVNFIKGGWINRNRILINNQPYTFTFSLDKSSSFKPISSILLDINKFEKEKNKLLKSIRQSYTKAPYFKEVMDMLNVFFNNEYSSISQMSIASVKNVCGFLGIENKFYVSSEDFYESKGMDRAKRLVKITKQLKSDIYINLKGGESLYEKDFFKSNDMELFFMENNLSSYKQFNQEFVEGLSIIDVLMFNSKETIRKYLKDYKLV